jgi:hypothetical protein
MNRPKPTQWGSNEPHLKRTQWGEKISRSQPSIISKIFLDSISAGLVSSCELGWLRKSDLLPKQITQTDHDNLKPIGLQYFFYISGGLNEPNEPPNEGHRQSYRTSF